MRERKRSRTDKNKAPGTGLNALGMLFVRGDKMYEKRVRKGIKLSILAGLLALIMVVSAFAAYQPPDKDANGSITVHMNTRSDGTGETVYGGDITIYRVGEIYSDDGNYYFSLTDEFDACKDLVKLDGRAEIAESEWIEYAQIMADYADEYKISGEGPKSLEDGSAVFGDLNHDVSTLQAGLYLLVQETPAPGYYAVDPFLVSLPLYVEPTGEYNYDVDASPKVEAVPGPEKSVDTDSEDKYDDDGVLVAPRQELSYKISFTNGHALKADIVISDELDKNVEYINDSAKATVNDQAYNDYTVIYDDHTLTVTLADVPARADGYITFNVKVQEPESEDDYIRVENSAVVKVGNDSGVETNVVWNPIPRKDVDVNINDEKDYGDDGVLVGVGQKLRYKIDYQNGLYQADVIITDKLDENVSYVEGSASDGGTYDSSTHTITWTLKDVEPEKEGYVTFDVEVLESAIEPGEVKNKATVKVDNHAEVETNEVHNPVPVKGVDIDPDDGLDFEDDGKGVKVGDTLTYSISYRNDLDEAATVTITDTLDERIDYVSSSPTGEITKDDDGNTVITWTIENVAPDTEGSVTFTATVNDKALEINEIYNTARVRVGDDNSFVNTNTVHNPRRMYFPIDEEIVPDYNDRTTWVKEESVNEYNAIEIEMSTTLPVIEPDDLDNGSFTMNFHEVLDSHLVLDEADTDFMVFIDGSQVDHKYYTITLAADDSGTSSPLSILPLRIYGNPITDGCTFHVDVDLTALYKDKVIDASHLKGDTEIIIFFFADLEGTGLNGTYKSTVWYDVYDDDTWQYTSNVDEVWVYTYEIDIDKTSSSTGNALAGARFGIYYDEECTDAVSRNGEDYRVTSDTNGEAVFYGLAEGTYYIKELEAPSGYVLSTTVHIVSVGSETGSRVEIGISNTPSGSTGHHGGGGGGSGGGGGGGSGSGGPGSSSGEGDSGGTVWDLLPLPETGQGWAMLIAVCAMIIAGVGLIVAHVVKRRN